MRCRKVWGPANKVGWGLGGPDDQSPFESLVFSTHVNDLKWTSLDPEMCPAYQENRPSKPLFLGALKIWGRKWSQTRLSKNLLYNYFNLVESSLFSATVAASSQWLVII